MGRRANCRSGCPWRARDEVAAVYAPMGSCGGYSDVLNRLEGDHHDWVSLLLSGRGDRDEWASVRSPWDDGNVWKRVYAAARFDSTAPDFCMGVRSRSMGGIRLE